MQQGHILNGKEENQPRATNCRRTQEGASHTAHATTPTTHRIEEEEEEGRRGKHTPYRRTAQPGSKPKPPKGRGNIFLYIYRLQAEQTGVKDKIISYRHENPKGDGVIIRVVRIDIFDTQKGLM